MNDELKTRTADAFRSSLIVHRSAFTLIEMLTTVAVLIIVLGLMVSLARHVREQSARQLTRSLLRQLDEAMRQYYDQNDRRLPPIAAILPGGVEAVDEADIAKAAARNNEQFMKILRGQLLRRGLRASDPGRDTLGQLPIGLSDELTIRDAWGRPIVFMPAEHKLIGLAPSPEGQSGFFFFSAGPDRQYLTRADNLYSYEANAER